MEIQVKNLKPNPYRDMERYVIRDEKVLRLKQSMEQTGFWDNILARPKPGHTEWIEPYEEEGGGYFGTVNEDVTDPIFEIAYGHHRLEALKQVYKPNDLIDIPVKELDDAIMVKIMANENREEWNMSTIILNETVRAARDFLDGELKKYETWDSTNKFISSLGIDNQASLGAAKKGVGQFTILKFLGGEPLWRQGQIQEALVNLGEEDITRTASEVFEKRSDSRNFRRGVKSINKQKEEKGEETISKEKTDEIAHNIKQRIEKSRGVPKISETKTTMETMIQQEIEDINPNDEYQAKINDFNIELKQILEQIDRITSKISTFNGKLDKEKIETLKGIQSIFGANSLIDLFKTINRFSQYLGLTFNGLNNIKEENNE